MSCGSPRPDAVYIELVGSLRCVHPHEPEWLVASSELMEARDIVRGVLGCPRCGARYPIERGIADFRGGATGPAPAPPARDPELALRAAALLGLESPGSFVVLAGAWGAAAPEIVAMVDRLHVLALDAPEALESGGGVSLALAAGEVPVRAGMARGVALDEAHAGESWLASAALALRPGGRLVAPATARVPAGMDELARDDRVWVATRSVPPGPTVPIGVAKR